MKTREQQRAALFYALRYLTEEEQIIMAMHVTKSTVSQIAECMNLPKDRVFQSLAFSYRLLSRIVHHQEQPTCHALSVI